MSDTTNKLISKKLDTLIKLTAINALRDKPQAEQIKLLGKIGFLPKDIASLVGTTSNTVSVTLSRAKKCGKKAESKKAEAEGRQ